MFNNIPELANKASKFALNYLPHQLKTQQWVSHFCSLFNFSISETDWGADRFQAIITTQSSDTAFQCMLCIEWLCEAIWLEPIGTQQSTRAIFDYLTHA